jgi:hypothetical protein
MQMFEQHSPALSQKLWGWHLLPIIEQAGGAHLPAIGIAPIVGQLSDSQSEPWQHLPPMLDGWQTSPVHAPVQHSGPAVHDDPAGQLVCWQTPSTQQPVLHEWASLQLVPASVLASTPRQGTAPVEHSASSGAHVAPSQPTSARGASRPAAWSATAASCNEASGTPRTEPSGAGLSTFKDVSPHAVDTAAMTESRRVQENERVIPKGSTFREENGSRGGSASFRLKMRSRRRAPHQLPHRRRLRRELAHR